MELIQGKTLREELDRAPERRLPEARVRAVTAQLVAALTAAHALSIWHLDLKPENVMVTEGDRIILLDFGAARQKFINLLAPLNVGPRVITSQAYTPEYAPPEVLLGWDTMGAHSDLFELGVMLYEMLYGKRPPPAFERYKQPAAFNPAGRRDSWAQLLMMALELDEQLRAADVAQWWEYETQRAQRAAQDAREQAAREAQRKEQLHEQERRRLVDDNQRLNEQVRHLQRRGTQALQDKSDLAEQLKQLQAEQAELLGELAWLRKYKPVMKALEHVGRWVWQIGQGALTLIGVALVILGWLLDQAAMIVGQLLIGLIGLFIKNDAWLVEQFPTERKRTLMLRLTGWPGFIVVLYMFYSLFGWFRSAA
jgi:serine/threonine protein kinase